MPAGMALYESSAALEDCQSHEKQSLHSLNNNMTPASRFINSLTTDHGDDQVATWKSYRDRIDGWSHAGHFFFFRSLLAAYPEIKSMLICGVYRGLDLAMISHILWQEHRGRNMNLVGVDLFSNEPCADWPEMAKGKSWEEPGMGKPPSMDEAAKNAPLAVLHKANSIDFLGDEQNGSFDFVYLDTAHDYETVKAEIQAGWKSGLISQTTILAGDDYSGPGHWGVQKVVDELCPNHFALFNRIWINFPII